MNPIQCDDQFCKAQSYKCTHHPTDVVCTQTNISQAKYRQQKYAGTNIGSGRLGLGCKMSQNPYNLLFHMVLYLLIITMALFLHSRL